MTTTEPQSDQNADLDEPMTDSRWEGMTPAARKSWFRARHARANERPAWDRAGLTSADLARLSLLPATPPSQKDAEWRHLHERLHAGGIGRLAHADERSAE